jgi:hypothetical protein
VSAIEFIAFVLSPKFVEHETKPFADLTSRPFIVAVFVGVVAVGAFDPPV